MQKVNGKEMVRNFGAGQQLMIETFAFNLPNRISKPSGDPLLGFEIDPASGLKKQVIRCRV
jgi:hypothetical protein